MLLIGAVLLRPGKIRLMLAGRSVQERSKRMVIPLSIGLLALSNLNASDFLKVASGSSYSLKVSLINFINLLLLIS